MVTPVLDFWFDFASTYSYPAAMRIGPLAEQAGVEVRFRPFLLGPIFKAQGWTTSPFNLYPAKGRHMWRDLERLCADLGLPFRRPDPFPQNSLLAARVAIAGARTRLGRGFLPRDVPRTIRRRPPDRRSPRSSPTCWRNCDRPAAGARSGAIGRGQGAVAGADRGGAAARPVRRAELHDCRRRIVLGQRPAGAGAALGEPAVNDGIPSWITTRSKFATCSNSLVAKNR